MLIPSLRSLSLDVLSNQLIKLGNLPHTDNTVGSPLQLNASVPFSVLNAALPKHKIVNKALAIWRDRATPERFDMGSRSSVDVSHTQVSHFF